MFLLARSPRKSAGQGRVIAKDSIGNQQHAKFNTYVPGSGVGASSIANRSARLRRAAPHNSSICYAFNNL